jgi:hypothetical protein
MVQVRLRSSIARERHSPGSWDREGREIFECRNDMPAREDMSMKIDVRVSVRKHSWSLLYALERMLTGKSLSFQTIESAPTT